MLEGAVGGSWGWASSQAILKDGWFCLRMLPCMYVGGYVWRDRFVEGGMHPWMDALVWTLMRRVQQRTEPPRPDAPGQSLTSNILIHNATNSNSKPSNKSNNSDDQAPRRPQTNTTTPQQEPRTNKTRERRRTPSIHQSINEEGGRTHSPAALVTYYLLATHPTHSINQSTTQPQPTTTPQHHNQTNKQPTHTQSTHTHTPTHTYIHTYIHTYTHSTLAHALAHSHCR